MNNEPNSENVFKPKKTPLLIGAVLLVLIVAIIVLAVFLLTRGGGSGANTDESPAPAGTSDSVLQNNPDTTSDPDAITDGTPDGTDTPGTPSDDNPETTPDPDVSGDQTTQQSPTSTTPAITTVPEYEKSDPTTFTETVDSESVGRGELILVDENHGFSFPEEKLVSRTIMGGYDAGKLKSEYNFVRVPSSTSYLLKNNNLFLNIEACTAFGKMMEAFAAATGHTDVQLRNAYYYDKNEQVCYNATGLFVDLEINSATGLYPLNYETLRSQYYDWFIANSYRFGFIHMWENQSSAGHDEYSTFRYVGIPHATYMHNNNVSDLEEYLNKLKEYTVEKVLTYTDDGGIAWQIYYVPKNASGTTEVTMTATPNSYSISGNNTDGYIVTINTAYFNR